ncbi:MAG: rhomboid family intramembrane serine protease [Johnsonella sp.]|nr:rhomboid family intramembrane serine protease [Johnsonella sp.]
MKKWSEKLSISINSPVVLGFASISLASLLLGIITQGFTTNLLFSVYRSSFLDPFTYIRFFGHIFGHADWVHFMSNMMLILVVGPLLEEKYGSSNILFVILATALVTGIANFLFFPYAKLLGASGVVFAFILLSSLTSIKEGSIPLTFILVALIYIGSELYEGAFVRNNISNLTHILGGIIGAVLGYIMNKYKMNKY